MSLKTENLAIVLTDIAGYTETTQNQSRQDNARLLATHNRILFPIVRRYQGRHVKSIGDALLLVFRSPTDAMLCAMAMQDALFEFNRNAPKEQQIHIRVAASLGEVRVTGHDVFGEAVNVTSRIESITPVDEIYLSEAVYMAMNKAEVPSQEVGRRELKGISGPIRIFNIPRFATPRLVPEDVLAAEDMSDLVYPYGGAHLATTEGAGGWRERFGESGTAGRALKLALAGLVLLPLGLLAVYYGPAWFSNLAGNKRVAEPRSYQSEPATGESRPHTRPMGNAARQSAAGDNQYTRISDARRAFRDNKISRPEYRKIVDRLEEDKAREINQAKRDLKADRISRKEYRDRVDQIERKYK
jgi:class 3 adenylate cyclase